MTGLMTFEEFKLLVKGMKAVYTSERFLPDADAIKIWYKLLMDLDYKLLNAAIQKYIVTGVYPPTIADLRNISTELMATVRGNKTLTAGEAWGEVMAAIRKHGMYNSEDALNSMSPTTQKVVRQIGWNEICTSDVIEVVRGQFMKMYDSYSVREKEDRLLPQGFKNQIELIAGNFNMLEAPEDKDGR